MIAFKLEEDTARSCADLVRGRVGRFVDNDSYGEEILLQILSQRSELTNIELSFIIGIAKKGFCYFLNIYICLNLFSIYTK